MGRVPEGKARVYTDEGDPVDIPQSRIMAHIDRYTPYGKQILAGVVGLAAVIASLGGFNEITTP